jgi:hypothetical protein
MLTPIASQPYATKVGDGHTVSAQPSYSVLGRNFIVANYAANGGCYDNDDGSVFCPLRPAPHWTRTLACCMSHVLFYVVVTGCSQVIAAHPGMWTVGGFGMAQEFLVSVN